MSFPTIAIIIGVSFYEREDILSLPAAQVDAVSFARALRNWGVPESNITLCLNADATQENIETILLALAKIEEKFKLIFYFCGHGYRESGELPKSYILLHNSYVEGNKCFNAISLDFIVNNICKLNIVDSYILIDACYLRVNTIVNPKGETISNKSLFCLLSSGIEESFESERGLYGYFTDALLKSLCKIRLKGALSEFLTDIHQQMESEGLPTPEMYNLGTQRISLVSQDQLPLLDGGVVLRHELIAKIQDVCIQNRDKIVCLIGDAGIGKSALCQCLASDKLKTFHISIPQDFTDFSDFIVSYLPDGFNLDRFDAEFPYSLIIVDQLERLTAEQVNVLLEISSRLNCPFLLVSNQSLKNLVEEKFRHLLVDFEVPPFTPEEGKLMIKMLKENCPDEEADLIYLVSQGNPLKMKKVANFSHLGPLRQTSELEYQMKKAMAAIYACGMYIDENLFAKTFDLETNILNFLNEIGLIFYSENSWIPHECLFEIAESELFTIDQETALNYWYEQIEDLPDHIQAAKSLIITVKCFGYEQKADRYLRMAFQTLHSKGKEYLSYFMDGAEIFLPVEELTETSLFLAQILIERGEYELGDKLLRKNASSQELVCQARLCQAQRLWHLGASKESVHLCTHLISSFTEPSQIIRSYFYRGIAHFLSGSWDEAFLDFTIVYDNAEEKYYVGRAQCMLGSILGLRGSNLPLGKEYLEAGSKLLMKLKDFSGVWAGWNNLGEIFWKSGEYRSSAFYLDKALELSAKLNSESAKLETLRNLLQLHFRVSGPFAKKVTELITEVENHDWTICDKFQQVQILNTLITAYIFRRNIKPAVAYLKMIISWTAQKPEYHLYTLSNLGLLYKLMGFPDKSKLFLTRALKLAEKNPLSFHQIKSDYSICFKEVLDDAVKRS